MSCYDSTGLHLNTGPGAATATLTAGSSATLAIKGLDAEAEVLIEFRTGQDIESMAPTDVLEDGTRLCTVRITNFLKDRPAG